jgi:magnesium and cobalt transporter
MMEGVLQVSECKVRDIMVPRAQMDVIDINDAPEAVAEFVVQPPTRAFLPSTKNKDDVVGILLAKDLLRYFAGKEFNLRDMLRPAVFVPESKRLNVLLREFRASRNHMAMVVDEYGGVAGLVTIEDVLEQIVGDIEDEYDFDEAADNIRARTVRSLSRQGHHRNRRFQRSLRHHVLRRGLRHRRRPRHPRWAACPSATKS